MVGEGNNINRVTVITVSYFSKYILRENINSVLSKVKNVDEYIIINNSPEENIDELKSDIVKIINNVGNAGYGNAINIGIKISKNDMLLIINPDIILKSFKIHDNIINNEKYIIGGMTEDIVNGYEFPNIYSDAFNILFGRISSKLVPSILKRKHIAINESGPVDWISGSLIFTNKKTIEYIGYFDEKYFLFYEEIDLCKRAYNKNIPVFITSDINYVHRIELKSSSINVNEIKITSEVNSFKLYYNKYNSKDNTSLIMKIMKIMSYLIYYAISIIKIIFNDNVFISNKHSYYKVLSNNL